MKARRGAAATLAVFWRGRFRCLRQIELAWVAQLVERVLGKDEVTGSIPVPGSRGSGCGLNLGSPGRKLRAFIVARWELDLAGRAGVTQR